MIRHGWLISLLIVTGAGIAGCGLVSPPATNLWSRGVATFGSVNDTVPQSAPVRPDAARQLHRLPRVVESDAVFATADAVFQDSAVFEDDTVEPASFQQPSSDPPDPSSLRSAPDPLPAPTLEPAPAPLSEPDLDRRPSVSELPLEALEQVPAELLGEPLANTLTLNQVIRSVYEAYPLLEVAVRERQIAAGKVVSAEGEFDLSIKGFSIAAPMGYYKNYRSLLGLTQPTYRGGYLYGGYRIGADDIQPWYKERLTNKGGEFALGIGHPLLQNRAIDKRRAALTQAGLARQAVEPAVSGQLLDFVRAATQTYWLWVAADQSLDAQRQLLQLAQDRVDQIELRVRGGDLERIARINNDQLIASRETKMIEAERKLQAAAIKLSLFLRDEAGRPVIPARDQAPRRFPTHFPPDVSQTERDIATALAARPELAELDLLGRQVQVELQQAHNMLLPKLDATVLASKDVGAKAEELGVKTPFELEAGILGEIPLQRREARGKIQAAQGKLAQLRAKRQFTVNKITAEVQDAVSALEAAAARIDRAATNLDLARRTLDLGRKSFDAGDIDLIALNIYEQSVTDAQLLLIAAEFDFFVAEADYRASIGADYELVALLP